jgi:hypothetical protein
MANSMRPQDGEKWFGVPVLDLTLVSLKRSPDWLFTFLKGTETPCPLFVDDRVARPHYT